MRVFRFAYKQGSDTRYLQQRRGLVYSGMRGKERERHSYFKQGIYENRVFLDNDDEDIDGVNYSYLNTPNNSHLGCRLFRTVLQ